MFVCVCFKANSGYRYIAASHRNNSHSDFIFNWFYLLSIWIYHHLKDFPPSDRVYPSSDRMHILSDRFYPVCLNLHFICVILLNVRPSDGVHLLLTVFTSHVCNFTITCLNVPLLLISFNITMFLHLMCLKLPLIWLYLLISFFLFFIYPNFTPRLYAFYSHLSECALFWLFTHFVSHLICVVLALNKHKKGCWNIQYNFPKLIMSHVIF